MVWETGVQSQVKSYQRLKNYKVQIKGEVEQSWDWSSPLSYTSV